jgi:hypothetical protein
MSDKMPAYIRCLACGIVRELNDDLTIRTTPFSDEEALVAKLADKMYTCYCNTSACHDRVKAQQDCQR